MILPGEVRKLKMLIRQFAHAKTEASWAGSLLPPEQEKARLRLQRARIRLDGFLIRLSSPPASSPERN